MQISVFDESKKLIITLKTTTNILVFKKSES